MLFIPINIDVPMKRWPIANWILIAVTIGISVYVLATGAFDQPWTFIGPGDAFSFQGLIGSLFTHLGPLHLLGNMLFLFVFGNAINAKLGHVQYLGAYLLLGAFEGVMWSLLADMPAAGASGAIMGILGMFVVFYPRNDISVFYWFYYVYDTFEISAYAIIAIYFAFDLWGVISGGGDVAYIAHLAGFVGGFSLASALVLTGLVRSDESEQHLYEALGMSSTS